MSTPDGFSDNPLVAEMERRCTDMLLVSQAVTTCADVFEQACEPMPPKAEWFEKWPHWNLCYGQGAVWTSAYFVEVTEMDSSDDDDTVCTMLRRQSLQLLDDYLDFDMIIECWPISESGAPVGWKVVGE